MAAMSAPDDFTSFLELDDTPTARRRGEPGPTAPDERMSLLDLVDDVRHPACLNCSKRAPVNELSLCESCAKAVNVAPASFIDGPIAPVVAEPALDLDFGAEPEALPASNTPLDFASIATESASNANVQGAAAADGGGRLPYAGFRNQDGYIQAIRNGVTAETHSEYHRILREQFKLSGAAIAKLNLPGPIAESTLPSGAGVVHAPAGHVAGAAGIFERPRTQRQFVVAPKAEAQSAKVDVSMKASELIAGAVAEGSHAISAWEGTTGMTRSELVAALTAIGREAWAPKAPNARAQAGRAIAKLGKGGYDVKALRKAAAVGSELVANEHVWTVGRVGHAGAVGTTYGQVVVRFKLSGSTLSYEGASNLAGPIVAEFDRRMKAEEFNSDVTSWLARTLRDELDAVKFGALGWVVPAKHVAVARQLTEAVAHAGFGSGWVHSLPVATSDQLRDGIVNGLLDEVVEALNKLRKERSDAKAARDTAYDAVLAKGLGSEELAKELAQLPAGDIGPRRRETYIRELRHVNARVGAYGEVLGEQRVDRAKRWLKDALVELEGLDEGDDGVCSERFRLVFEELAEEEQRAAGGDS